MVVDSEPFEVGDVVRLQSCRNEMTVVNVYSDYKAVVCCWFLESGALAEARFPQAALIKYKARGEQ